MNVFVAPNTIDQYTRIVACLISDIAIDPFIQAVMNNGVVRGVLANTFVVTDRTAARGTALLLPVPAAPFVQVFR